MTGPVLYDRRTHSCASKQHWAGQSVGPGGSSAKGLYFGGRPPPRQPSAGRVQPDDAPRCAGVAEMMLHDRETLFRAESAMVPFSTWYGPALVSLARHVQLVLHKCTTRYTGVNDTGEQHEDGGGRAS